MAPAREDQPLRSPPTILYFSPERCPVPVIVRQWAALNAFPVRGDLDAAEIEAYLLRGHPAVLFLDGAAPEAGLSLVRRLKDDPYTAIIPAAAVMREHDPVLVEAWLLAGADEVLTGTFGPAEQRARIDAMLRRAERDVAVHPSTRLPGTTEIEREAGRRLARGAEFAMCYADLDHFKEFNDRYSYRDGDRVIHLLSRLLHDVVRGMAAREGFVAHIGGDDFIFIVPASMVHDVCTEILAVFDLLIPLQYSESDRRTGYFFGKDRRGQLHRVPLMTLSIGVVTNRHRHFRHAAEVSELASEMKGYAKTLPGSIFVVDRRRGAEAPAPTGATPAAG